MYTNRARYWKNVYAMHCTWVAWSWCGKIAANAVEYGTEINGILQFKTINYCIRYTARSNIATFAYRTRTVCNTEKKNDYCYYYRVGTVITMSGSKLL